MPMRRCGRIAAATGAAAAVLPRSRATRRYCKPWWSVTARRRSGSSPPPPHVRFRLSCFPACRSRVCLLVSAAGRGFSRGRTTAVSCVSVVHARRVGAASIGYVVVVKGLNRFPRPPLPPSLRPLCVCPFVCAFPSEKGVYRVPGDGS